MSLCTRVEIIIIIIIHSRRAPNSERLMATICDPTISAADYVVIIYAVDDLREVFALCTALYTVVNKNTCLPSRAATPGTIGALLPTLYGVDLRFRRVARENHSYDRHTCLPARTSRRVFFTTMFVRR